MATMTIHEAEHVIDIVITALERDNDKSGRWWHAYKSNSDFKGYDIFQIDTALKLRLANMFLYFAARSDFEEQFIRETKWCHPPFASLSLFIPDSVMAKINRLEELSKTLSRDSLEFLEFEQTVRHETATLEEWFLKDKKFLSLETADSFAKYCRSLGANDPIYWQKIYTRIGLEYCSSSPKGNDPVLPRKGGTNDF